MSGYELGPRLAAQVDGLKLTQDAGAHLSSVHWMELVRDADGSLPAPSARCIEQLTAAGSRVHVHTAPGEPYWSSTEIVCNDESSPPRSRSFPSLIGLIRSERRRMSNNILANDRDKFTEYYARESLTPETAARFGASAMRSCACVSVSGSPAPI